MNKFTICLLALLSGTAFAQQDPSSAAAQNYPPNGYQAPPPPEARPAYPANVALRFTVPVVSANPAYQTQTQERRVCDTAAPAPSSGTNAVGTIIGGIAGGILGHQVGKGTGKTLATAAGAVGGAVVGNTVANNMEGTPACQMVAEQKQVFVGYDVVYDFSVSANLSPSSFP